MVKYTVRFFIHFQLILSAKGIIMAEKDKIISNSPSDETVISDTVDSDNTNTDIAEVCEDSSEPENEDFGVEAETESRILPPDELFSDTSDTEEGGTEDEFFEPVSDTKDELLDVDEEGQYTFSSLLQDYEDEHEDEEDDTVYYEDDVREPKYNPEKPRKADTRFDFVELFVFTLFAVMLITTFLFRHSIVDGESMEGTLYEGEYLITSDFFYKPKQGDIIVCEDYTTSIRIPIVKRVIATEGQEVKIIYEDGENRVYVDGVLLDEDYVYIDDPTYRYKTLCYVVPEGEVFVMGDHRNKSADSRIIGSVSEDSIIGKVLLRFFPFSKFGTVD